MHATEQRPLKVLTPQYAERLRVFNSAARELQRQGIRLLCIDPASNSLDIEPQAGGHLLATRQVAGYQRSRSAGSTLYTVQYQGVTLSWRAPISYPRPEEWAPQLGATTA